LSQKSFTPYFIGTLDLDGNFFENRIPTELSEIASLESLRLGTNLLSGTIPTELAQLVNLLNLELQTNFLTGTIPTEFGDLPNLEIDTSGNNLSDR